MTNGGDRDGELQLIRQLLIATARKAETNDESISQVNQQLSALTLRVDQTNHQLSQLTSKVETLASSVAELTVDAQADRELSLAILERVDELALQNTRVWQYLTGVERNGDG